MTVMNREHVTYRAYTDAVKYTRYNGERAARFVENGTLRGKDANAFRQKELMYLQEKSYGNILAKAYNGYCFLVSRENGMCVAMYPLPQWFGKVRHYENKKEVRDIPHFSNGTFGAARAAVKQQLVSGRKRNRISGPRS